MAKKMISFLGTNNYTPCNYCYDKKRTENVRYIQQAVMEMFCHDFGPRDRAVVFLTDEARKKNWESNPEKGTEGLENILKKTSPRVKISGVRIPGSFAEKDIWEIFRIVFAEIDSEDEIVLDITHAFRFLPMLAMVLLNYARVLKNIRVRGIYYGAFEALNQKNDPRNIPLEKRDAPVFDLTGFHTLQLWSVAAEQFVNSGRADVLRKLQEDEVEPKCRKSQGSQRNVVAISNIIDRVDSAISQISTCRGRELISGKEFIRIRDKVSQSENNEDFQAFSPLLKKINEKFSHFEKDDPKNGFWAVKWCLDHGMIQQGITLLQETVVSYFLEKIDWKKFPDTEKMKCHAMREFVSGLFRYKNGKENYCDSDKESLRDICVEIKSRDDFKDCAPALMDLRDARNSINHGGFCDNSRSVALKKNLERNYHKLLNVLYPEG